MSLMIETRILNDPNQERFHKELTLPIYKPTIEKGINHSGTFMHFGNEADGENEEGASDMHYHPGQRSLHIFTTSDTAGVILNFCGIKENPEDRKDSEVYLEFPKNAMVILNFPPYTPHQFYPKFVCTSVHPQEGSNIISAAKSGQFDGKFLEGATVISGKQEWKISQPEQPEVRGKEKI
jgi:hypothetical protein